MIVKKRGFDQGGTGAIDGTCMFAYVILVQDEANLDGCEALIRSGLLMKTCSLLLMTTEFECCDSFLLRKQAFLTTARRGLHCVRDGQVA